MYGFTALPLFNNGYQPIPIKPGTKQPDSSAWQNEQGEAIVQQHIRTKPNHGVGVNNVNSLDFDITDTEICNLMELKVQQICPGYIKRIGKAPKFLVPMHSDSGVSKKFKSTWLDGDGQKHMIEVLHKGQQQFVIFGDHPDTQQPYTWYGSDPLHTPADQLPIFSEENINTIISFFDEVCEDRGFTRPITGSTGPQAPQGTAEEQALWSAMPDHVKGAQDSNPFPLPPETIPFPILEQCVNLLPAEYCDDRDLWFRVGGVIYDLTLGSTEGFNLFDTWSQKSTKYNANPNDTTALKWKGYTIKEGNAGLGSLIHWLEQAGIPFPTAQQGPGPEAQPAGQQASSTGPDPLGAQPPPPPPPESNIAMSFDVARENFMYLQMTDEVADIRTLNTVKYGNMKKALGKYDRLAPGRSPSKSFLDTWRKDPKSMIGEREWFRPVPDTPVIREKGMLYFNPYKPEFIPKLDKWDPAIVEPVLKHMQYILPETIVYEAFLDWMAFKWRYPWLKTYAFLIVTTSQQTGKGVLTALFRAMFGKRYVVPADTSTFSSNASDFNEYLSDSIINFCDEAKFNKAAYDKLKAWVYEPELHVNKKNGFKGTMETFSSWLIFSNHLDSAVINREDQRLAVSIMRDPRKTSGYYAELFGSINNPDKVLMSHFVAMLEARDISQFRRHEPPWSNAKASMVAASKDDLNYIIEQMIDDEIGPCKYDVTSANLVYHYLKFAEEELKTTRKQVSAVLERLTTTSRLEGYHVMVKPRDAFNGSLINSKRQKALLCLRHYDSIYCWKDADNEALKTEYLRSREAAVMPNKPKEEINKMQSYEI